MAEKHTDGEASIGPGPLAWVFARYANFTLGGGSATTAVLHHQLSEKRRWLSDDAFTMCFALGRLTPGTNVLAFCVGAGWLMRGLPGALIALLAASIPCTLLVVVLTGLFDHWRSDPTAEAALRGAVAAAVAITVKTCWTIAKPHFKIRRARPRVVLIGAAAFVLYVVGGMPAIEVLLLAGIAGALLPMARA